MIHPNMPAAVIFDMDGTLLDTERVSQAAWRRAAADFDITIPEETLRAFIGCSLPNARVMINELFGDEDLTDRLFAHEAEVFFQIRDAELVTKPGALACVRALADAGIPVALATSTAREHALPSLDRFGFREHFRATVFGDEVARSKPEPDIYLEAARRLELDPRTCVAVEDSFNGVRAGAAAGMRVIMVPDFDQPTPEIRALCHLVLPSLHELTPQSFQ